MQLRFSSSYTVSMIINLIYGIIFRKTKKNESTLVYIILHKRRKSLKSFLSLNMITLFLLEKKTPNWSPSLKVLWWLGAEKEGPSWWEVRARWSLCLKWLEASSEFTTAKPSMRLRSSPRWLPIILLSSQFHTWKTWYWCDTLCQFHTWRPSDWRNRP